MRFFSLMFIAMLSACGGEGQESSHSVAEPATPAETSGSKAQLSEDVAPCEMLTEAMVRDYLQPGDVEISGEQDTAGKGVYCQYKWSYPLSDEERQQAGQRQMEWITAKAEARSKGEPIPDAPKFPNTDSNVFFNVLKPFENAQTGSTSFDMLVQRLTDGIKVKTEELGDVEFKGGDLVMVEGLGDKAFWDPKSNQVSVLTGVQLFHLKVRLAGGKDSRADAERIAADLVKRF